MEEKRKNGSGGKGNLREGEGKGNRKGREGSEGGALSQHQQPQLDCKNPKTELSVFVQWLCATTMAAL